MSEHDPNAEAPRPDLIVEDTAPHAPIPARILIADDEPRNLLAVSAILAAPGLDLVTVGSGEEALRRVLREDFAAILLDVRMPGMDGYEAAALIRARPRSSRVPILFMTAYDKDDLHVFRGYSAGAVDFVFKPIEPIVLKSKVDVFVDLYRKTEEIRRQHAAEKALLVENLRVRGEKLEAEKALRRGAKHQSLVLRELPVALYTAALDDPWRRLRFSGEGVDGISGFAADAFADAGFWRSRLHAEDAGRAEAELRALAESGAGSATVGYRWLHPDGTERHVMDRAVVVLDEEGAPREVFGMWFDVTDRKELESRLMHASKLEAVGRLTGGIAHDFNNMLNVVIGNLELLGRSVVGNDRALKRLQGAIDGAQRCADLTARLLAFSRRSPLQAAAVDPARAMPGIVDLLRRTLGERVEVHLDLAPDLPAVRVDPSQFESALVNLAVNARDAMPDGGHLRVGVARVPPVDGSETGPGAVEFTVADTGAGMEPAVLSRVFEPFFTTKQKGKGTGLGLSMVYGFVQQSEGQIDIRSGAGQGTTIVIRLPGCADGEVDGRGASAADDGEPVEGRGETVLLVEDDEAVRQVASAALKTLGFAVREAESGDQAAAMLDHEPDVRLVVSDVRMPGRLNGIDLGRLVRRHWPAIPVLLMSGFVDDGQDFSDFEFLQKPYRVSELMGKLKTVLNLEPIEP